MEKYSGNIFFNGIRSDANETTPADKINKIKQRAELGLILNNWIVDC